MGSGELILIFAALMVVLAVLGIAVDWIGKPLRNRRFIPRIYRFADEDLIEADPGRTAFSEDSFRVPTAAPQGVPYVDATGVSEWAQSHFVLPDPKPADEAWGALTSDNPTEDNIGFAGLLEVNTYDTMEQSALLGDTEPLDPAVMAAESPQAVLGIPAINLPAPPTEDVDLLPPPPPAALLDDDLPPPPAALPDDALPPPPADVDLPPPPPDDAADTTDETSFFGNALDDDDDVFFAAEEADDDDATTDEPVVATDAADDEPVESPATVEHDADLWPHGVFDPTAENPAIEIVPVEAANAGAFATALDRDAPVDETSHAGTEPDLLPPFTAEPEPEPVAEVIEPDPEPIAVVIEPEPEPEALEPDPDPEPEAAVIEPDPEPEVDIIEPEFIEAEADTQFIEATIIDEKVTDRDATVVEEAIPEPEVIEAELVTEAPREALTASTFTNLIETTPAAVPADIGGLGPLLTPEQATSEPGIWMPGDPLWTPTAKGTKPSPTLVRRRFWQSASVLIPGIRWYGVENIERMAQGHPPRRRNRSTGKIESMQITGLRSSDDRTISRPYWPSNEPDPFEEF